MSKLVRVRKEKDNPILSYIAVWQFLSFMILLCLIWVAGVMDLPAMFFDVPTDGVDVMNACILSAAVIVCAIITVGNTYLQQQRALKGLHLVCPQCKKVKTGESEWQDMEQYLRAKTHIKVNRNLCPTCLKKMEEEVTAHNEQQWVGVAGAAQD